MGISDDLYTVFTIVLPIRISSNYLKATKLILIYLSSEYYQKLTNLKRRGVKVSLAIGGWNDSQGDKYSRLVNSPGQ